MNLFFDSWVGKPQTPVLSLSKDIAFETRDSTKAFQARYDSCAFSMQTLAHSPCPIHESFCYPWVGRPQTSVPALNRKQKALERPELRLQPLIRCYHPSGSGMLQAGRGPDLRARLKLSPGIPRGNVNNSAIRRVSLTARLRRQAHAGPDSLGHSAVLFLCSVRLFILRWHGRFWLESRRSMPLPRVCGGPWEQTGVGYADWLCAMRVPLVAMRGPDAGMLSHSFTPTKAFRTRQSNTRCSCALPRGLLSLRRCIR